MSIFDPEKIARNERIVNTMPDWKKGQPMPDPPKQKLPRISDERLAYMVKSRPFDHSFNDVVLDLQDVRMVNTQLLEALRGWLVAWEDGALLTSSRKPAELYRAGLLHDTKAAIQAAEKGK